jgi:hypothetical protein
MAKNAITDFDTVASNNVDIESIDLGEGTMVPSSINNSLRSMMSLLAKMNAGTQPLADTFTVADPADLTKAVRIDAGNITTATTRVLTAPDADATIAGLSLAQEFTKTQNFDATTLTDAANISWDASANQVTSVTIADSRTMDAPTNMVDGACYVITVIQDSTGGYTMSWNSVFKFADATAPVVTATADARSIFVFVSDGTNMYEIGRSLNIA